MKTAIVLSVLGLATLAYLTVSTSPRDGAQLEFDSFIQQHRGDYKTAEEYELRLTVFKNNLKTYEVLNEMNPNATFGVTQFSDRTEEEMGKMMGDHSQGVSYANCKKIHHSDRYTKSVSWKNYMTPIKNQASCGSCYAFAATSIAEVMYQKRYGGSQVDFAEQQLVDCDYGSYGCDGGFVDDSLTYWKLNDIAYESQYEYRQDTGYCRSFGSTGIRLNECYALELDKHQIVQDLQDGPVAIGVFSDWWSGYKGGVITKMPNGTKRHAVVLIEYDWVTETILIRNSWGPYWGENGNIRLGFYGDACGWTSRWGYSLFF